MEHAQATDHRGPRSNGLVRVLAAVAVLCGLAAAGFALLPGPLYASGLVDLGTAFAMLAGFAPWTAAAAAALGLLTAGLGVWRRRWVASAGGIVVCAVGVGVIVTLLRFQDVAQANPLHDVTTNLDDPPAFRMLAPRQYTPNGPDARAASPHPDWRATHAELYPDIVTLELDLTLDQAMERTTAAAEEMGWAIEGLQRSEGTARIEAVATTGWFGFKDDIVVLMSGSNDARGVAVDARSVSRVGIGDVGANAERLRRFLVLLSATTETQSD